MAYMTNQYLINRQIMSDANNINTSRIANLIELDNSSAEKDNMRKGINYYNVKHDIINAKRYYYVNGIRTENKVASNYRIPHAFFRFLNNQKTSYICGKPIIISLPEPDINDPQNLTKEEQIKIQELKDFKKEFKKYLGDTFNTTMSAWVSGAGQKGQEIIHFYIDPDGELKYCIVPAEECILIYDTQYLNELLAVVRYYTYEYIAQDGQLKELYKVEWWTKTDVTYWEQQADGSYILDAFYDVNPAGHFYSFFTQEPGKRKQHGWNKVPFVVLKNNPERTTDLEPIKDLIDAYDKVKSGWCNDINDFQEMILVVKGYSALSDESQRGLSELAIFMKNLREHRVITVEGDGDVKGLRADIPVDAKEKFLGICWREIFYFGGGVDMMDEKGRSGSSGAALRLLFTNLDLKADLLISEMKLALKDFFWFITKFINIKNKKQYDSSDFIFTFNKSIITNQLETVQMLNMAKISQQTYLENLPFINDADEEKKRIEREQTKEELKSIMTLDQMNKLQVGGGAPLPAQIQQSQPAQSN